MRVRLYGLMAQGREGRYGEHPARSSCFLSDRPTTEQENRAVKWPWFIRYSRHIGRRRRYLPSDAWSDVLSDAISTLGL